MRRIRARVLIDLRSPYAFWALQDRHRAILRQRFSCVEIEVTPVLEAKPGYDVFFGWQFQQEWLEAAHGLKWIASPSAGCEHLPLLEADARDITVTRAFGYHGPPMAAHAMGLILGFSRGLFLSRQLQTDALWWKDEMAAAVTNLVDQTITIVGCGHIGTDVARLARADGMKVRGVRRRPPVGDEQIDWVLPSDIDESLNVSAVVVDLLPATAETNKYFGQDRFDAMRSGAIFLNLGRASTVDHRALLTALDSGSVAWCGLDVHEVKPPPMDDPLRHHPRVVLTPKSSVFSDSYMDDAVDFFAGNLARFLSGEELLGHLTGPRRHSL